jgi:hypothetical protein
LWKVNLMWKEQRGVRGKNLRIGLTKYSFKISCWKITASYIEWELYLLGPIVNVWPALLFAVPIQDDPFSCVSNTPTASIGFPRALDEIAQLPFDDQPCCSCAPLIAACWLEITRICGIWVCNQKHHYHTGHIAVTQVVLYTHGFAQDRCIKGYCKIANTLYQPSSTMKVSAWIMAQSQPHSLPIYRAC